MRALYIIMVGHCAERINDGHAGGAWRSRISSVGADLRAEGVQIEPHSEASVVGTAVSRRRVPQACRSLPLACTILHRDGM